MGGESGWADLEDEPAAPSDAETARQEALLEQQINQKAIQSELGPPAAPPAPAAPAPPQQAPPQDPNPVDATQGTVAPPAQEPPTGEVQAPLAPKFTDDTLQMAGLTADEAGKSFPSEEALLAAIAWQDQQAMLAANQVPGQQRSNAPAQRQQAPPAAPAPAPQQAPPQQPQPPQAEEFKVDLDPDEWGENTVEFLNRMNDHYQKQMQAGAQRTQQLENALVNFNVATKQKEAEQRFDEFDAKINTLPDAFNETFGKGTRHTLQGTPQFDARVRLNGSINAIASGRAQQGMPALTPDQLFDRAVRAEFGQVQDTTVRQEVVQQVQARQDQQLARPTARQGKPLSKEAQAQANVDKFLRERGLGAGHDLHGEIEDI